MCFSRRPFPMLNNLLNGSPFFTIKYEQYFQTEYFILISSIVVALSCRLYRYSTRPSPSLHLSCRRRWSSFGGGWNGESSPFFLISAVYLAWFQGKFREDNFSAAMATLRDVGDAAKGDKRGRRGGFKGNLVFLVIVIEVLSFSCGNERFQDR